MPEEIPRDEWLAERRSLIGASDAAKIICGSWYPVWAEKTGLVDPDDLSDIEAIWWGTALEEKIAERFSIVTGRSVKMHQRHAVVRHPDYEWLGATPDCYQEASLYEAGYMAGPGLLELKTTNQFLAKTWDDEPPLAYQVQLQAQLAVTGYGWGSLCALIGGQRLKYFDMERDDKFIEKMIDQLSEFWELVKTKTPPDADDSEWCSRSLKKLYPSDDGSCISLGSDFNFIDTELVSIKEQIKELDSRKTKLENELRAAIGSATMAIIPSGACYTLKEQFKKEYTVAASSTRVLRRKA